MIILIKYIDFHWDNYQGGSGKSFKSSLKVEIPREMEASEITGYAYSNLMNQVERERPFKQDNSGGLTVISMEIL